MHFMQIDSSEMRKWCLLCRQQKSVDTCLIYQQKTYVVVFILRWGASNEYPQNMFSQRNKNIDTPVVCSYKGPFLHDGLVVRNRTWPGCLLFVYVHAYIVVSVCASKELYGNWIVSWENGSSRCIRTTKAHIGLRMRSPIWAFAVCRHLLRYSNVSVNYHQKKSNQKIPQENCI